MSANEEIEEARRRQQSIEALERRLDLLIHAVERMEARLDVLYEECQRIGGSSQRTLLRQKDITQSLARIEGTLRDK